MRVILTGGGTGGHIYPAIAIGRAIAREWPGSEFLYVGTNRGLEERIIPAAGFPFATIDVEGWQRRISWQAIHAGWKAMQATSQAGKLIKSFHPQIVIGTGGYVCLPVVWSAARQGIPTLIHEQNAKPGLANKFLSKRVRGVLLTFPDSKRFFTKGMQKKLKVTGLPVRPEIMTAKREEGLDFLNLSHGKLTVLVVGGSRGARSINLAMVGVMRKFAGNASVQFLHLTGPDGFSELKGELGKAGIDLENCGNIIIRPYLHEMEYALACADLCVARAGAAFLAEMTVKGVPGILIPYPFAAENHQEYNARSLAEQGAAEVILDRELNGEILRQKIEEIVFDPARRKTMAENSLRQGKPDSIDKIIRIVRETV